MNKIVFLIAGIVLGSILVFGLARFVYRPAPALVRPATQPAKTAMASYIDKQKQALASLGSSEFDAKASQQLEQFMGEAITITDTAKNTPKHQELQQFATDSTYSWGYNREVAVILLENFGLLPKHEGQHCDSVGSC